LCYGLQEYPEDAAASSDSQMLLSFEEFKQIMDDWDVIPIFVNPHKFAQHKQVRHSAMWCAVGCWGGRTGLDSFSTSQQCCDDIPLHCRTFASPEARLRQPRSCPWCYQKLVVLLWQWRLAINVLPRHVACGALYLPFKVFSKMLPDLALLPNGHPTTLPEIAVVLASVALPYRVG